MVALQKGLADFCCRNTGEIVRMKQILIVISYNDSPHKQHTFKSTKQSDHYFKTGNILRAGKTCWTIEKTKHKDRSRTMNERDEKRPTCPSLCVGRKLHQRIMLRVSYKGWDCKDDPKL